MDEGAQDFSHWIAGDYTGGEIPAGIETQEIPARRTTTAGSGFR
ncbi:MAG: hypothetical protein ACLTD8_09670 [Acutalibacteraceae bacterium]